GRLHQSNSHLAANGYHRLLDDVHRHHIHRLAHDLRKFRFGIEVTDPHVAQRIDSKQLARTQYRDCARLLYQSRTDDPVAALQFVSVDNWRIKNSVGKKYSSRAPYFRPALCFGHGRKDRLRIWEYHTDLEINNFDVFTRHGKAEALIVNIVKGHP